MTGRYSSLNSLQEQRELNANARRHTASAFSFYNSPLLALPFTNGSGKMEIAESIPSLAGVVASSSGYLSVFF